MLAACHQRILQYVKTGPLNRIHEVQYAKSMKVR